MRRLFQVHKPRFGCRSDSQYVSVERRDYESRRQYACGKGEEGRHNKQLGSLCSRLEFKMEIYARRSKFVHAFQQIRIYFVHKRIVCTEHESLLKASIESYFVCVSERMRAKQKKYAENIRPMFAHNLFGRLEYDLNDTYPQLSRCHQNEKWSFIFFFFFFNCCVRCWKEASQALDEFC